MLHKNQHLAREYANAPGGFPAATKTCSLAETQRAPRKNGKPRIGISKLRNLCDLGVLARGKTPPSCLRPEPRASIALPGTGGERSNLGPSLRQFRRYPITRQTHSFVRSQGFVRERHMVRPDADLRILFSSCELTAQDEHGSLSENVPDTVTFPLLR